MSVVIEPPEAVADGARWMLAGGIPRPSGSPLPALAPGTHRVQFANLANWREPSSIDVVVMGGRTSEVAVVCADRVDGGEPGEGRNGIFEGSTNVIFFPGHLGSSETTMEAHTQVARGVLRAPGPMRDLQESGITVTFLVARFHFAGPPPSIPTPCLPSAKEPRHLDSDLLRPFGQYCAQMLVPSGR